MKQRITTLFAIVGVTLLAANIYSFFRHQSITSQYWENCKKVKPGMTLEQARTIIGDVDTKIVHKTTGQEKLLLISNQTELLNTD